MANQYYHLLNNNILMDKIPNIYTVYTNLLNNQVNRLLQFNLF